MQRSESNRHETPCDDAAFPLGHSAICLRAQESNLLLSVYEAEVVFRSTHPRSRYSDSNRDQMITNHPYSPLYYTGMRASRRIRTGNPLITNQLRFLLRQRSMIGAAGIEPAYTAYKTGALPLDEAPERGNSRIRTCDHSVNSRQLCR